MTIHLTIDEMLEILEHEGSPAFPGMKQRAEEFASACAAVVQATEPRLIWAGDANREPLAFAGTCATFSPREPGPVPGCLLNMDVEVDEWKDMCLGMAIEVRL